MEWERAKSIILTAFVLLNLGLAWLVFLENNRYTLSQERIGVVFSVLAENNINMYTMPMRNFAPMRHLEVSGYYYDIDELLKIFFEEGVVVEIDEVGERHYEFYTDKTSLEISNGFIFFDNHANLVDNDENIISIESATAITDAFILKHFPDFVREMVLDAYSGGGLQIVYRQNYRGQIVLSNEIEFLVSSRGIEWVEMQFGRVMGYSAEARMIFAPDEILLTFMQRMRHEAMENPIFISDMDMVYLKEYASDREGQFYPAVPFYRIFVMDRDDEFLINAYTNAASF